MSAPVEGIDLTSEQLFLRGDHLDPNEYGRTGPHADALEAAVNGAVETAREAAADRALSDEGVAEIRSMAASAALGDVKLKTDALVALLEKEQQAAGGNPFVLTQLPGVDPDTAEVRRMQALDLFLDQLKAQPEDRRDIWLESQLMSAAAEDRKVLLGAVYGLVGDLGPGAYGVTPDLLERVQEAHFAAVAPEKVALRNSKRAAAQLARANAANAERKLRAMGAELPE